MGTHEDHNEAVHVHNEAMRVARAMIEDGGSFVHYLGHALEHADHANMARIKDAFPEYWKEYKAIAGVD